MVCDFLFNSELWNKLGLIGFFLILYIFISDIFDDLKNKE